MKKERNFKRKAKRMNVQELRLMLIRELGRLNNTLNNVGIVFDQEMTDKKEEIIVEAQSQCAYISNIIDYLFEKLASLKGDV